MLVHWPIKDGPVPEVEKLRGLARLIAGCLTGGAVVHVHCQAGMNRYALVVARNLDGARHDRSRGPSTPCPRTSEGSLSDEYGEWLLSEDR
jgi:hypothetical protein